MILLVIFILIGCGLLITPLVPLMTSHYEYKIKICPTDGYLFDEKDYLCTHCGKVLISINELKKRQASLPHYLEPTIIKGKN
jgi:hypothetical protein